VHALRPNAVPILSFTFFLRTRAPFCLCWRTERLTGLPRALLHGHARRSCSPNCLWNPRCKLADCTQAVLGLSAERTRTGTSRRRPSTSHSRTASSACSPRPTRARTSGASSPSTWPQARCSGLPSSVRALRALRNCLQGTVTEEAACAVAQLGGGVADGRTAGMQQAACMPSVRLNPRPAERRAGRMHGMVSVPL